MAENINLKEEAKKLISDMKLTYSEASEIIGITEGSLRNALSKNGTVSIQVVRLLRQHKEILELKEKVKIVDLFFKTFNKSTK